MLDFEFDEVTDFDFPEEIDGFELEHADNAKAVKTALVPVKWRKGKKTGAAKRKPKYKDPGPAPF